MSKVFTNGCFDALHVGHVNLLEFCKILAGPKGSVVVAVDDDEKVERDKNRKPLFRTWERAVHLSTIPGVDKVRTFRTDEELLEIIKEEKPDIIVKGHDWLGKDIVGSDEAAVHLFPIKAAISTSLIIERAERNLREKLEVNFRNEILQDES